MTIPDCSNCAHGSSCAWRCKVFNEDVTRGETASCTAFRAADRNGVNDELLKACEELLDIVSNNLPAFDVAIANAEAAIRAEGGAK